MSITHADLNSTAMNRRIAAAQGRLARWLTTPPVAGKNGTLPKELENAENWLLDDLGLVEPAEHARERASGATKPKA